MSKRIDAVFVPEAWTNDYAVEIDGRRTEDVTKKILAMNLGDLHILEDNDDTSDGLVGTMDHTGPFRIEVTDSISSRSAKVLKKIAAFSRLFFVR